MPIKSFASIVICLAICSSPGFSNGLKDKNTACNPNSNEFLYQDQSLTNRTDGLIPEIHPLFAPFSGSYQELKEYANDLNWRRIEFSGQIKKPQKRRLNKRPRTSDRCIGLTALKVRQSDITSAYEPNEPLCVVFDKQIEPGNKVELLSITPEIANYSAFYYNNQLFIRGDTIPDTTYKVTIKPGFKGRDSSVLENQTVEFHIASYKPRLLPPAHAYQKVEPRDDFKFPIKSVNIEKLRVRIFDGEDFGTYWNRISLNPRNAQNVTPILDQTIEPRKDKNKVVTTYFDISKTVKAGNRQLAVRIEQLEAVNETKRPDADVRYSIPPIKSYTVLIQATDLNVTCFPIKDKLVFYVCSATSGLPIHGAKVSRYAKSYVEIRPEAPEGWKKHYQEYNRAIESSDITDKDGLAWLPARAIYLESSPFLVRTDNDSAVVLASNPSKTQGESHSQISSDLLIEESKMEDKNSCRLQLLVPFKNSSGIAIFRSHLKTDLLPIQVKNRKLSLKAPDPGPGICDSVFALVKVYENTEKTLDDEPDQIRRSRSAIGEFGIEWDRKKKALVLRSTHKLRHPQEQLKMYLTASPTCQMRGKTQPIQKPVNYSNIPFLTSPSSLDGLIPASSCPVIGLDWQVRQLHAKYSGSHCVGINMWRPIPTPWLPPEEDIVKSPVLQNY